MHDLRLAFVGSGNAFSEGGLCCNGFLVNDRILFETPPQILGALNQLGVSANALDTVVISHHHGDHFLGLPFLLLHWRWKGRTTPVTIVGPPATKALATDISEKVFPGVLDLPFEIEWCELPAGERHNIRGLEIEAVGVEHDEKLSATLGYACTLGGRRFSYTGDTRLCDGVLDLARRSELLVSECASRADLVPIHMNLVDDMPKLRAAMDPDAHLLLTHLSADVDAAGLKNTTIARDLARFTF